MIRIVDTFSQIEALFTNGEFNPNKWEPYINSVYENSADFYKNDLKECLNCGKYVYEKDFLPIINAVYKHENLETLHHSFNKVTTKLNERILECFGTKLDVDIVLYVGLCNAAGWATCINGTPVILLGIEKILELNWYDEDSMRGLVYHELGHICHKQHGKFGQHCDDFRKNYVWQLFKEGFAMYFEQILVGDLRYYHQNRNGWRDWCDGCLRQIVLDFHNDLPTMTKQNQKYFGDWVNYHGKSDVGYYLGSKMIHFLTLHYRFEELINMDIDDVYKNYLMFVHSVE